MYTGLCSKTMVSYVTAPLAEYKNQPLKILPQNQGRPNKSLET